MAKRYKITYNEKQFLSKYTCIVNQRSIVLMNVWRAEGTSLLYGWKNQFEVASIAIEDITGIEVIA